MVQVYSNPCPRTADYTWPTFHVQCANDKDKSKHFLRPKLQIENLAADSKSLANAIAIFSNILKGVFFQVQVCSNPWPRQQTILGPHFTRIVLITRKSNQDLKIWPLIQNLWLKGDAITA